jgi:hypothetical protein
MRLPNYLGSRSLRTRAEGDRKLAEMIHAEVRQSMLELAGEYDDLAKLAAELEAQAHH